MRILESQARFKKGELVMIRNKARKKGEAKWHGPYLALKNHAKGVEVKLADGRNMSYHDADISRLWILPLAGNLLKKNKRLKLSEVYLLFDFRRIFGWWRNLIGGGLPEFEYILFPDSISLLFLDSLCICQILPFRT
jgi:hypothetical protein